MNTETSSSVGDEKKPELKIVPYKQTDLDQMMEIENRVFTSPWTRGSYQELAPLNSIRIWVVKNADVVMGYMLYQFWGDEMELHSIAVKPELQKKGIGSRLMEHMLIEASKIGIRHIYLLVRPSNLAARALYKKYGFEVVGARQHYYHDNAENALIMSREERG